METMEIGEFAVASVAVKSRLVWIASWYDVSLGHANASVHFTEEEARKWIASQQKNNDLTEELPAWRALWTAVLHYNPRARASELQQRATESVEKGAPLEEAALYALHAVQRTPDGLVCRLVSTVWESDAYMEALVRALVEKTGIDLEEFRKNLMFDHVLLCR